jgi:hypothetical protein
MSMGRKTSLLNGSKEGPPAGQAALEYLLLLGGGVLIALIAFLILLFIGPYGGGILNENIIEYEKIDLCTASDSPAVCSFFLDWEEGLLVEPLGFKLENQSNWRTLVVDGLTLRLYCGSSICTENDFTDDPFTTLTFPIQSDAPDSPACDVYNCPVCDPANPGEFPNCYTYPNIPFCDVDSCEVTYSFPNFSITVDPASQKQVGVALGGVSGTKLSAIQYSFHVSELSEGSLITPGVDDGSKSLFWYSSYPNLTGSSFQCSNINISDAGFYEFGCDYAPGCVPVKCNSPLASQEVTDFCTDQGYLPGGFADKTVCETSSGVKNIMCYNESSAGSHTLSNDQGAVVRMDASLLLSASSYIASIPPGVYLEDASFAGSGCIDDADCSSTCNSPLWKGSYEDVELYSLQMGSSPDLDMCKIFSNPLKKVPLPATLSMIGAMDEDNGQPRCVGRYALSDAQMDTILAAPQGHVYLGVQSSGGPFNVYSIFNVQNKVTPIRISSLFYPK